jgi:hypothetical protein
MHSLTDDLTHLVIPDLIRNLGFPVETGTQFLIIDPCLRRDDVWIPGFAGMTFSEYRKGIIEPSE